MNTDDSKLFPPRPVPHPQFHDRTRFVDEPFSAEALEWVERFRQHSANTDRAWGMDQWPPARPARALVGQAAFRSPLKAAEKMVLLALCACADAQGVAMYHMPRFALFCGLPVADVQAAFDRLTDTDMRMLMHWTGEGEWSRECVTLVVRPELWAWAKPGGGPPDAPAPIEPRPVPAELQQLPESLLAPHQAKQAAL